jgi:uncharacterized membrane protein YfcA
MFAALFAVASFLYASVGQAGGTAFLALMAFAAFPPGEMRPTALLLNVVSSICSTWLFNSSGHVDWAKLKPLLVTSIPAALIGGCIVLDERFYKIITGTILVIAAVILTWKRAESAGDRDTPLMGSLFLGLIVGFISGITGLGGGFLLAPALITLNWASPRQTAAISAPFICANSLLALLGALYAGQLPSSQTWLFAIAALIGAVMGATLGMRYLSQNATRYVLASIVGAAGLRLLL